MIYFNLSFSNSVMSSATMMTIDIGSVPIMLNSGVTEGAVVSSLMSSVRDRVTIVCVHHSTAVSSHSMDLTMGPD